MLLKIASNDLASVLLTRFTCSILKVKPAVDSDILRLNICGCSAIEWDVTHFDNFVL